MAEYDLIIKAGMIVDGTRAPRYRSDIAIKDGRIARVGGLKGANAAKVLDASGLIVAPGFVDLHTHYDAQVFWDPYCTLSGWHGVTSVAIGNCGFGFAPCKPEGRERAMLSLTRNEAIPLKPMQLGMPWDWETFPEFLHSLERIPKGVNLLSYVPLTPVYAWVMGWDEAKVRRPTEAELREMCRLVHVGMDAGACGWSAQVAGPDSNQRDYDGTPMITDLMTSQEILAFARVLAERDEGYIELAYREPDEGRSPIPELTLNFVERVAEVSGRPVLYQVVLPDASNPMVHRQRLDWLADCARRGLRVYGQGQTTRGGVELTFEDWNLYDMSPAWREVTLGTIADRKAKMQEPELRSRLREEWDSGGRPGNFMRGSVGGLVVQKVGNEQFQDYIGRTVAAIAQRESKHIIDALLDLVVADNLETEFWAMENRDSAEYTAEVLNAPHVVPGLSDGGAHLKFMTSGNYPTGLLTWMVRDEQRLSLEEAHYKLSYLPAFMGGFRDRGTIREGAAADIVVYDLENLKLLPREIARDLPGGEWRRIQRAEGYHWTLVNGQMTFEDGKPTGATPGKLLRHGRG